MHMIHIKSMATEQCVFISFCVQSLMKGSNCGSHFKRFFKLFQIHIFIVSKRKCMTFSSLESPLMILKFWVTTICYNMLQQSIACRLFVNIKVFSSIQLHKSFSSMRNSFHYIGIQITLINAVSRTRVRCRHFYNFNEAPTSIHAYHFATLMTIITTEEFNNL